jgi:hypothetical protein
MLLFSLFFSLFITSANAMVADPFHSYQDYEALASERPEFDSACAVLDNSTRISQSGVLVAPDVVATAAHGIEAIIKDLPRYIKEGIVKIDVSNMRVLFLSANNESIEVEYVLIDARYFENVGVREGKFDFAYLKLKKPSETVKPAEFFNEEEVPNDAILTVVTHGIADQPLSPILRRAFRLYERDFYYGNNDRDVLNEQRYLQESSIYFKPSDLSHKPSNTAPEELIRSYEATQNWTKDGKKPYALALPGSSGAPVYIRLKKNGVEKDYLFGLVNSYAHLSGVFHGKGSSEYLYILDHPKDALNSYQTIFCLFYTHIQSAKAKDGNKVYKQDPTLKRTLMTLLQKR